jgi:hypothetical protein
MTEHDEHDDLERASELADARLGVAEDLGWPVALLSGLLVLIKFDSWLLALAGAVATYFLATWRYRRGAEAAEDKYFRAAGLGKYAKSSGTDGARQ